MKIAAPILHRPWYDFFAGAAGRGSGLVADCGLAADIHCLSNCENTSWKAIPIFGGVPARVNSPILIHSTLSVVLLMTLAYVAHFLECPRRHPSSENYVRTRLATVKLEAILMTVIAEVVVALTVAYGIAILILLSLQLVRSVPVSAVWLLSSVLFATPLLIKSNAVVARSLFFFPCVALWFKLTDYAREIRLHGPYGIDRWIWVLVPFPAIVSGPPRRIAGASFNLTYLWQALSGVMVLLIGFWLLRVLHDVDALRQNFLLDHCLKFVVFVFTVESLSFGLQGLERLAGFDTTLPIHQAFLAKTVGEFWTRYNTRVHAWIFANVYKPLGGHKSPIPSLFVAFFVSAIIHELAFGVATSRFDGYQFAFFMAQAPAVVLSHRLDRWLARISCCQNIVSRVVTIAWFLVSSSLFFRGVDRVFPVFYASQPWLP